MTEEFTVSPAILILILLTVIVLSVIWFRSTRVVIATSKDGRIQVRRGKDRKDPDVWIFEKQTTEGGKKIWVKTGHIWANTAKESRKNVAEFIAQENAKAS